MRRRILLELGSVVTVYCLAFGWRGNVLLHKPSEVSRVTNRSRQQIASPAASPVLPLQIPRDPAWPPPAVVPHGKATACIAWRQTGGCVPTGPREPERDLGCAKLVRGPTSGYCECEGGRRANEVGCFHKEFTCDRVCRGDREWQLPLWGQEPLSVADFEQLASGSRCHAAGNIGVLVAAPFARSMHVDLRRQLFANLLSLECANAGFNLYFALYDEPFDNEMDARRTKVTGRSVLATIRNRLIGRYLDPTLHEFVLWMDADVTQYPPDLVAQLHAAMPLSPGEAKDPDVAPQARRGIVAPLVIIEGSDELTYHERACRRKQHHHAKTAASGQWKFAMPGMRRRQLQQQPEAGRHNTNPAEPCAPRENSHASDSTWAVVDAWATDTTLPLNGLGVREDYPRPGQFYDRAGFMPSGVAISQDVAFPGSAHKWPPYLGESNGERNIACEGVGTVYMIPTVAYTTSFTADGNGGPPEHFPTAFTEHFPVVHAAKYGSLGLSVSTALDVVVKHADLPSYGLQWHREPMSIWSEWLDPYLGRLLSLDELRVTKPPAEWCTGDIDSEPIGDGQGTVVGTSNMEKAREDPADASALRAFTQRPSCVLLH